jgi:hypothetical protein
LSARGTLTLLNNALLSAHFWLADHTAQDRHVFLFMSSLGTNRGTFGYIQQGKENVRSEIKRDY